MAGRDQFSYALLRVVPHVERGECLNAGVVLFCRRRGFLAARVALDEGRLRALAPDATPEPLCAQLEGMAAVAAGDPSAGPLARLEQSERFHWLAAPSSTVIQPGPVHTGLTDDPQATLDRLFARMVAVDDAQMLPDMRRAYDAAGLAEADVAPTWREQFERWLADADRAGLTEPNAIVLATADPSAAPSARTVLLKGVDDRGFVVFTNLRSRKAREALANPAASIVVPWIDLRRQVVVTGAVEPVAAAEADAYFASRPRGSQLSAIASQQSEVVSGREALERAREEVAARYAEGEAIPRPEHWGGLRIVPDAVEFWQGRPDRLHDRLRFRRGTDGSWGLERLAP